MLSELTLTVMRLGLLVLMWFFVFAVVGVLRGDLYGTRVKRRTAGEPASRQGRRARRRARAARAPHARRRRTGPRAAARAPPGSPSRPARWPAPRCRCARPAP